MKKMTRFMYATALSLVLAACGRRTEEDATVVTEQINDISKITVTNALDMGNGPPPESAANLSFPVDSAFYNAFEVAVSELAVNHAYGIVVRTFAHKVAWVHAEAEKKLEKVAASEPTMKLPKKIWREDHIRLQREEQIKFNTLAKLGGSEFDQAYLDGQVVALGEMLDRMKDYAQYGNIWRMKGYAERMVPIIEALLKEANSLPR